METNPKAARCIIIMVVVLERKKKKRPKDFIMKRHGPTKKRFSKNYNTCVRGLGICGTRTRKGLAPHKIMRPVVVFGVREKKTFASMVWILQTRP